MKETRGDKLQKIEVTRKIIYKMKDRKKKEDRKRKKEDRKRKRKTGREERKTLRT